MKSHNMRSAFIRLSITNTLHEDNEKLGLKAGDIYTYTLEDVIKKLDEWCIKKPFYYYVIQHDEDEENVHLHLVLEFKNTSQCRFTTLKKMFPYGQIDSCRHSIHACVRYLVHADNPEKYQYSWEDVYTNAKGRLEKYKMPSKYSEEIQVQKLCEKICNGEIKEHEFSKRIEPKLYVKYKSTFNNAVDFYVRNVISNPSRDIKVFVFQGPPRIGKSTMCKVWAEKHNKSICFSSAQRDPWQDYHHEDVFVWDEPNFEKSSIEDFLKVFEPHYNSSVSARYRNKVFTGSHIMVTTNTPVIRWFEDSDRILREALFKRITYIFDFQDYKMKYNPKSGIAYEKYLERLNLKDGIAKYSINKICSLKDCGDKAIVYTSLFEINDGFFLKCVEGDEAFTGDTIYHYFDLKKYILKIDDGSDLETIKNDINDFDSM